MNNRSKFFGAALACALLAGSAATAATVAYEVVANTAGNQSYTGRLGMDFTVNSDINVLSLGAFDDNGDGISGTLITEIWSRSGNSAVAQLATLAFSNADQGTLVGGSRFKDLSTTLLLTAGDYTVVSYGYNGSDQNGNNGGNPAFPWSTNDGGGALSFTGGGRFGGGSIGTTVDGGTADRYAAGTFSFENVPTVPLPAGLPLLLAGLGGLGIASRRNKA
jgi:hypothetical protein